MKKLFLILFLALLLVVPMVSAIRIDYTKNDAQVNDMKVVISDTILFGLIKTGEQGTMELKSHKSPTEVIQVGLGEQVTMYYDFNFKDLYSNGLGEVKFINMKNGQEVQRDYKFVYEFKEERTRDICLEYEQILNSTIKGNETYSQGKCLKPSTETYLFTEWKDYNSKDIPKGNIRLGLMVDNKRNGDWIDGVWNIQGKSITKHASWNATLDNGLVSYYKLDETSGTTAFDSLGTNNGTTTGATLGVTGKIGTAYSFDASGEYISLGNGAFDSIGTDNGTISMWFYYNAAPSVRGVLISESASDHEFVFYINSANKLELDVYNSGNILHFTSTDSLTTGNWYYFVYTSNSSGNAFYLNNTELAGSYSFGNSGTSAFFYTSGASSSTYMGNAYVQTNWFFPGTIDEVGIWDRSLSSGEITKLYNDGDSLTYGQEEEDVLEITQFSPTNDTTTDETEIDFIFNVTDAGSLGIKNVSLVIDGTIEQTNTSTLEGNYTMTETLSDGTYNWWVVAYDDDDANYTGDNFTLTIDTTPDIQFVSPTPDNASNLTTPYIPVNVTVTETYFENVTFNFYKGGVLNETVTFTDGTRFYNKTGCTCDNWEINVTTCTTTGKCNSTETRLLTIDLLAPDIVINAGEGVQDYGNLENNHTINFTVNDTHLDSVWIKYKNQISVSDIKLDDNNLNVPVTNGEYYLNFTKVSNNTLALGICDNLALCEGSYVYQNIPSSCLTTENIRVKVDVISNTQIHLNCYNSSSDWQNWIILASSGLNKIYLTELGINPNETINIEGASSGIWNSTSLELVKDLYNARIYANDTFGNTDSYFVNWSYKVFENSVTYNNETIEGNTENFILNITLGTGYSLSSGTLHYNGQTDVSSIFSSGLNSSVQSDLFITNVVGDTNKTFYWVLTLAGGSTVTTQNYTQLVTDLIFDNCTAQPNRLFTLFLKDEETKEALNGTIEVNLEIVNPSNFDTITDITAKYEGLNEQSFCTNVNFSATSFLLNAEIRYSADNYSAEFYHIQRAALSGYPVNISLFDLADADTTIFKVNYRGADLIGVEGAIVQLQRKYIEEGIYELVEAPLTSSGSSTVLHIDTKTNKYQVTVVKNGVVLGVFENLVFVCESELTGECTINLFEAITPGNTVELETLQDFSYSISTVNKTITTSFTIPSGTPREIQVVVYQDTIVGRTEICNTTITSSAGSIDCVYTDSIEDSVLDLRIYKSDSLIAQKGYLAKQDLTGSWNGDNYFIVIIFMLSLVFMAITSPEMIIIVSIITMLFAGGVWLLNGLDFVTGLGTLVWLILAAIILIMRLSKQEDR